MVWCDMVIDSTGPAVTPETLSIPSPSYVSGKPELCQGWAVVKCIPGALSFSAVILLSRLNPNIFVSSQSDSKRKEIIEQAKYIFVFN